jgi:rubrerythrin
LTIKEDGIPNPSLNKRQRNLQERIMNQYFAMQSKVSAAADIAKSNRIMGLQGKGNTIARTRVIRLFCPADEGELVKAKGLKQELSGVVKPRWKCPVCFSFYSGWRPDELKLESDSNVNVRAIYTTWGD